MPRAMYAKMAPRSRRTLMQCHMTCKIMPTERVVVQPPFTYCRNPMPLGTILGYCSLTQAFRLAALALGRYGRNCQKRYTLSTRAKVAIR